MKIRNLINGLLVGLKRYYQARKLHYRLSRLKTEVHNHPETRPRILFTGTGGRIRDVPVGPIEFKVEPEKDIKL